tara:strand:+ start:1155 stop:1403 length:249 start_codon:yes stop_codon:yes gene_type:complete
VFITQFEYLFVKKSPFFTIFDLPLIFMFRNPPSKFNIFKNPQLARFMLIFDSFGHLSVGMGNQTCIFSNKVVVDSASTVVLK